jgi:hypothetical protein
MVRPYSLDLRKRAVAAVRLMHAAGRWRSRFISVVAGVPKWSRRSLSRHSLPSITDGRPRGLIFLEGLFYLLGDRITLEYQVTRPLRPDPATPASKNMADIEWLPARQLREHYVDPIATDISDAQRRLYLAVVTGQVRARLKGRILDYKQIALMSGVTPFSLSSEIELSVEAARRKWGGP